MGAAMAQCQRTLDFKAWGATAAPKLAALIAVLLGWAQPAFADGAAVIVQGGPWRLAGRVYQSEVISARPHLVVVLHGDSPFGDPTYQYTFARRAAAALGDAVVVGLLRPGYRDGLGGISGGERGATTGDNYTPDRIDSLSGAVEALAARYHASDVTLVGHSGGSAISADILALHPGLASRALLVSCPCDLPTFRRQMFFRQRLLGWLLPVASISPQDVVARIPKAVVVRMVTGSADPVASPSLTLAFADALRARGGDATVTVLPGLGHDILLDRHVMDQLRALIGPRTTVSR